MNPRTRAILIMILAAMILALCYLTWKVDQSEAATKSPTPITRVILNLAPPVPCTAANRMDIFEDEDSILWECMCEALKTGYICHWQVVGGVEPRDENLRKWLRKRGYRIAISRSTGKQVLIMRNRMVIL